MTTPRTPQAQDAPPAPIPQASHTALKPLVIHNKSRLSNAGSWFLVIALMMASGCSDWLILNLPPEEEPEPPPGQDDPPEDDPPVDDPPVDDPPVDDPPEDDPPEDDPPEDDPPPELLSDCAQPAATATWTAGEIWVSTTGYLQRSGTLTVSDEGLFDVYSSYSAESGDTQWNESAYYRIENESAPEGKPSLANCGEEWVVRDIDNFEAWQGGDYIYLGTFSLAEGDNTLRLSHYCLLYAEGECEEFHFTDDPTSTCESSNPNSAHFSGELCLLLANDGS